MAAGWSFNQPPIGAGSAGRLSINGRPVEASNVADGVVRYMDPKSLCPDLLGLDYIGEADHLRGRVVRAFFSIMRLWPKP